MPSQRTGLLIGAAGVLLALLALSDAHYTQSDMFLALVGAVTALMFLSGLHDRQLKDMRGR